MKPIIIGAGLAGLTAALSLAPEPVIVLCIGKLGGESSSCWAQGGIAASVGLNDTAQLHAADTLKAGAGLCEPAIVQQVTEDGQNVIARLIKWGAAFDRDADGQLCLGLEGAHGCRRIVHAAGDATGKTVMQALIDQVRKTPSIQVIENAVAMELVIDDGISGVMVKRDAEIEFMPSSHVVLATGGAGTLWQHTTNPRSSWGHGLALAARVGARFADLEFMQFHPTAIDIGRDPMPLASEALRGEGAILVDERGERFVNELEPRDVVARAIWQHSHQGHKIYLDSRDKIGTAFSERFPSIYALCLEGNIDPVRQPIPVCPAAHYHMGGIMTDENGRTHVQGLWACGEVASTGLNGANRLASNSLLEAASFGRRVAEDIKNAPLSLVRKRGISPRERRLFESKDLGTVRTIMSKYVGLLRDKEGLERAISHLTPLAQISDRALVGLMIATAALRRGESRGAHKRSDYTETLPQWAHRQVLTLADILPAQSTALGA